MVIHHLIKVLEFTWAEANGAFKFSLVLTKLKSLVQLSKRMNHCSVLSFKKTFFGDKTLPIVAGFIYRD